jgi:hypothetical protein
MTTVALPWRAGLSREQPSTSRVTPRRPSYFAALATLHGARITLGNLGLEHAPG